MQGSRCQTKGKLLITHNGEPCRFEMGQSPRSSSPRLVCGRFYGPLFSEMALFVSGDGAVDGTFGLKSTGFQCAMSRGILFVLIVLTEKC